MIDFRFINLRRGQGLLEAILAIGMILVGLGAILTFTLKNIAAAADSGQRIVAANLAREGIDVVRAIRDSNWLAGSNSDPSRLWDDDLQPTQGAALDFVLPTSASVPAEWAVVYLNSRDVDDVAYALYRHAQDYDWRQFPSGAPDPNISTPEPNYIKTGYKRILLLDPVCDTGSIVVEEAVADCTSGTKIGIRVTATVSWASSGFFGGIERRELSLVEYLYNWR